MTAANFRTCLREILRHEGGYANHPADPGGATMKGVTQAVYDAWRRSKGKPARSVRLIEDAELEAIYRAEYWDEVHGDDLPSGVDLITFDLAVNSGVSMAARFLQKAVGAVQDGEIGPKTLSAVAEFTPTSIIEVMRLERERFYRSLRTFPTFGKGWLNRLAGVYARSMQLAGRP